MSLLGFGDNLKNLAKSLMRPTPIARQQLIVNRKQTSQTANIVEDPDDPTKHKANLPDGTVMDAILSGKPRAVNSASKLNSNTALCPYERPHRRGTSGKSGEGNVILMDLENLGSSGQTLFYIAEIGKDPMPKYPLDIYPVMDVDPGVAGNSFSFVRFSPNGKHIFCAHDFGGGLEDAHIKWGWALDWKIEEFEDQLLITYTQGEQGELFLNSATLPVPDAPTPPSVPPEWTSDGTATPGVIFNFEEEEVSSAIPTLDTDLYNLGWSFVLWDDGPDTPRVDFIGNWHVEQNRWTMFRSVRSNDRTYSYASWTFSSGHWHRSITVNFVEEGIPDATWKQIQNDDESLPSYIAAIGGDIQVHYLAQGNNQPQLPFFQTGLPWVVTPQAWGRLNERRDDIGAMYQYFARRVTPEDTVILSQGSMVPTYPYVSGAKVPRYFQEHPHFDHQYFSSADVDQGINAGVPVAENTGILLGTFAHPAVWAIKNTKTTHYIFECINGGAVNALQVKQSVANQDVDLMSIPQGTGINELRFVSQTTHVGDQWEVGQGYRYGNLKATVKAKMDQQVIYREAIAVGPSYWITGGSYLSISGGVEIPPFKRDVAGGITTTHCIIEDIPIFFDP